MHIAHISVALAAAVSTLVLSACGDDKRAAITPVKTHASETTAAASASGPNGPIAFMRPGTVGEYDIWRVEPDGTGLRRLTKSPESRSDYNPNWSPDGHTLLFERRKLDASAAGGDEALYAIDAAGGEPRQVTHCSGVCWSDDEGTWSPDGKQIAFGRATGPRSAPGPSLIAIDAANADGTGVRQLSKTPHGWEDHYPTWSADGRTVVFQRVKIMSAAGLSKLVSVDVKTRAERLLYALPAWAPGSGLPKFSRQGQLIFGYWCIFGDQCPPKSHAPRNARIATISPTGQGLRPLPLKRLGDSGDWAPDGESIVFRCQTPAGFRLCTSRTDGTHLKQFPWALGSAEPDWAVRVG
jgi:Tol biopolymer transport system component